MTDLITLPDGSTLRRQTFNASDIETVATVYSVKLTKVNGVDPKILMLAIAAVESSSGQDCGPRHEPAYDIGGSIWSRSGSIRTAIVDLGSGAACSYGPWQMMWDNLDGQPVPESLVENSDLTALGYYAQDFVQYFNSYVMHFKPSNLAEIGEIWNAGHITSDPAYVIKLQAAYSSCLRI